MTLSDVKIRNLKPKPKTYKVADFDGLYIAVNPNGSKLWRFKYRLDGKEKLLSIGTYPAISLAQARQARDAARAEVAAGGDPSETKQEQKRIRRESRGHTFENVGAAFFDADDGQSSMGGKKMKGLVRVFFIFILLVFLELLSSIAPLNTRYSVLSAFPESWQERYIEYVMEPRFGYFRNCFRKTAMLMTIDYAITTKQELSVPTGSLEIYASDAPPIAASHNCAGLEEPGAAIARRAMGYFIKGHA